MTRLARALLYYLFTLLFIVITPTILFIASGYSLDITTVSIQQEGMILVEVAPSDALLTIPEIDPSLIQSSRGAARISGLTEGTYTVRIAKEGFFPFETKVPVKRGAVSTVGPVKLIRTTQSFLTVPFPVQRIAISASQRWMVLLVATSSRARQLILLESASGALRSLPELPKRLATASIEQLIMSPDEQKILLVERRGKAFAGTVLSIAEATYSTSFALGGRTKWLPNSDGIATVEGTRITLYPTNRLSRPQQIASSKPIRDILPTNDGILSLVESGDNLVLEKLTMDGKSETISNVPEFPPTAQILDEFPPFVLVKTPSLVLPIVESAGKFTPSSELPAAGGVATDGNRIITLDNGKLFLMSLDDPDHIKAADLPSVPSGMDTTVRLATAIPGSPWALIADSSDRLVLVPLPQTARKQESTLPNPIILENTLSNVSWATTDPTGRRLLIVGAKGNENGVFLRLLTE